MKTNLNTFYFIFGTLYLFLKLIYIYF